MWDFVNRVAKEVGLFTRIEAERQTQEAYVKGTRLQQAYVTRMTDLKAKLDIAKTQDEKKRIQAEMTASDDMFKQNAMPLRSEMQRHEQLIVATFKNRLQPVIQQVARTRRLDIVMYAGPTLAYIKGSSGPWGRSTDITEEVVARAKQVITSSLPLVDSAITNQPAAER